MALKDRSTVIEVMTNPPAPNVMVTHMLLFLLTHNHKCAMYVMMGKKMRTRVV